MFILTSDLTAGSFRYRNGSMGNDQVFTAPDGSYNVMAAKGSSPSSWISSQIIGFKIIDGSSLHWHRMSDGTLVGCKNVGVRGTTGSYSGTNFDNNVGRGATLSEDPDTIPSNPTGHGTWMATAYTNATLDGGAYKVMMQTYHAAGNEFDKYVKPSGKASWNLGEIADGYYLLSTDSSFSSSGTSRNSSSYCVNSKGNVQQVNSQADRPGNETFYMRLVAYPTGTVPSFAVDTIDKGPLTAPDTIPVSVSNASSVTATIDGGDQKTFTVSGGSAQVDLSQWWGSIGYGAHTVLIRSSAHGYQCGCKLLFTKSADTVSVTTEPHSSANRPASCRLIGNLVVPTGAVLTQEVTNNGNDESPVWETYEGTSHEFANESKTASLWGLASRVSINNSDGNAVAEIKDSLAMGVLYEGGAE